MPQIHPTAIVHPLAKIDSNVIVGPYCTVGEGVELSEHVRLHSHVVVSGHTVLGAYSIVHPFAVIGGPPQLQDEQHVDGRLIIGTHNVFREHVTIHVGSEKGGGATRLGHHNLLMVGVHIGHDCQIASHCTFANGVALAGHAEVHEQATIGGFAGVHQYSRIGKLAMVGAGAMCSQDVPPFSIAHGDRARLVGMNRIGIRRAEFSPSTSRSLKRAWNSIFLSGKPREEALKGVRKEYGGCKEVAELLAFCENSQRGICRAKRP